MKGTMTETIHFAGWTDADFDVFGVEGLEERMAALIANTRVKLTQLGEDMIPVLNEIAGEEMFAHVAKHARRKTNPPHDSWVAWSKNKRGYKMYPHFQIGAWQTHAFVQFGIIYESPMKGVFAEQMIAHLDEIKRVIPSDYLWYPDHMDPRGLVQREMEQADFERIAHRLANQKNGEVMIGIRVPRQEAVAMSATDFLELATRTFRTLSPLYKLAFKVEE
ncbi:MAG: YktB family protein [Tumebacillaceae bacterium]